MLTLLATLFALAPQAPSSPHPAVRDLQVDRAAPNKVELTLEWPNAWRNARNHDAAWLVLRGADATQGVLRLAPEGHGVVGEPGVPARLDVSEDRCGAFVFAGAEHRGDVSWRLSLTLAEPAPEGLQAWAVGMVYVPAGGFELGDTHEIALRFGAFHRVSEDGADVYEVADEAAIEVGDSPGKLWYATDDNRYRGDQGGPIPASFPKGTQAFYVMKHEVSQGLYADFLSALPAEWRAQHAPLELEGQEVETCSIASDGDLFVAGAPLRPCNFLTWDDSCALLDWLALRPMTEFEFEKAARGPRRPVALDYPWGTSDMSSLERTVLRTRDLAVSAVADEATLDDANKARLGASYYWVMDLSGSLWERVVSAGHAAGRTFLGTHGDGQLSPEGAATNEDWPASEGRDAPGIGYRGGAEYFGEINPQNPTNPNSPTAMRTYAGWGGAYRYKTYSARGCRSAR